MDLRKFRYALGALFPLALVACGSSESATDVAIADGGGVPDAEARDAPASCDSCDPQRDAGGNKDGDAAPIAPSAPAVLLFGGWAGGTSYYADTWSYDGAAWQRAATSGPSPRAYAGLAVESGHKVLLYGGTLDNAHTWYQDTWEWNGGSWTRLATEGPSVERRPLMATLNGTVFLYEGVVGRTWEWNGSAWAGRGVAGSTPMFKADAEGAMTVFNGKIFLYGAGLQRNENWWFDGNTWTLAGTFGGAGFYDPTLAVVKGKLVMYGGSANAACGGNFYEWDGTTFKTRVPAVPITVLCYRRGTTWNDHLLIFGGAGYPNGANGGYTFVSTTWEWDDSAWVERVPGVTAPGGRAMHSMVTF